MPPQSEISNSPSAYLTRVIEFICTSAEGYNPLLSTNNCSRYDTKQSDRVLAMSQIELFDI